MENEKVSGSYYEEKVFLKDKMENKLCIFIIDDNKIYAQLLKNKLQDDKNFIHLFSTGEEALNYTKLAPDFIIIDYHLDGVDPNAKNGNEIAMLFEKLIPGVETMVISSDFKLTLLEDAVTKNTSVQEKDDFMEWSIEKKTKQLFERKQFSIFKRLQTN